MMTASAQPAVSKAAGWSAGEAFRACGQIVLRRGDGLAAREALAAAGNILAQGGIVAIYPEGTRSCDGKLGRGNTGPGRLALASGANRADRPGRYRRCLGARRIAAPVVPHRDGSLRASPRAPADRRPRQPQERAERRDRPADAGHRGTVRPGVPRTRSGLYRRYLTEFA
jgi:1-acyl-sn-glycerol-3-phosphate acyltransferase